MKFIKVSDELFLSIDAIECVEYKDQFKSIVKTSINSYEASLPASVLVNMIETSKKESGDKLDQIANIMKQVGTFAG